MCHVTIDNSVCDILSQNWCKRVHFDYKAVLIVMWIPIIILNPGLILMLEKARRYFCVINGKCKCSSDSHELCNMCFRILSRLYHWERKGWRLLREVEVKVLKQLSGMCIVIVECVTQMIYIAFTIIAHVWLCNDVVLIIGMSLSLLWLSFFSCV